ncbi:hypothetical protein L9F63_002592, partial [Diploptera punctata]
YSIKIPNVLTKYRPISLICLDNKQHQRMEVPSYQKLSSSFNRITVEIKIYVSVLD